MIHIIGKNMDHSRQQIYAITQFIAPFEADGFQFGSWSKAVERDGYFTPSFFLLSDEAQAFVKALHDNGWIVRSLDWSAYAQTAEALALRDDPASLEQASLEQVSGILTIIVRQDRFVDGSLANAFASGLVLRILRRIKQFGAETGKQSSQ